MPFTIPNQSGSIENPSGVFPQAQPDQVDIDILVAALGYTGTVTGCAVTPQGTPNMTVAVASGTVTVSGAVPVSVSSGNVTITAADSTNPRFDLIVANNSGTKSATAGTPSSTPVFPAIPANSVVLAAVYVPAGVTSIIGSYIIDKRAIIGGAATFSAVMNRALTSGRVVFSTTNGTLTDASTFTFNSGTGALTATNFVGTFAGNTFTTGTGTLTIAASKTLTANNSITIAGTDGKTLTLSNSLTLAGTDSTTMTFPSTNATIARTDAAQTFTGVQTFGTTRTFPNTVTLKVGSQAAVVGQPTIALEGSPGGYGAGIDFVSGLTDATTTVVSMAKIVADGTTSWTTTTSTQDAGLTFYTAINGTLTSSLVINPSGTLLITTPGNLHVGGSTAPGTYIFRVLSTTGDMLRISPLASGSGIVIDAANSGETVTSRNIQIGATDGPVSIPYRLGIGPANAAGSVPLDVDGNVIAVGTRTSSSGNGGQVHFRKDTGASAWAIGVPGSGGATSFFMYDLVNSASAVSITPGATPNFNIDGTGSSTGKFTFGAAAKLKNYTVATLPTAAQGDCAYVTDASAPTYGATVAGGGAVIQKVFYNGTNWVCQ